MRVFYPQSWVLYQILWIWFLHWVRNWSLWAICLSNEVVRRFLFIVRRALFRGSSLIEHLLFESIWGRSFFNNFTVEMIALIWLFRMKCQFLREFWCGSCQTSDWKDRNLLFWSIKRGGPRLSGLILFIMLFQFCRWVHKKGSLRCIGWYSLQRSICNILLELRLWTMHLVCWLIFYSKLELLSLTVALNPSVLNKHIVFVISIGR